MAETSSARCFSPNASVANMEQLLQQVLLTTHQSWYIAPTGTAAYVYGNSLPFGGFPDEEIEK